MSERQIPEPFLLASMRRSPTGDIKHTPTTGGALGTSARGFLAEVQEMRKRDWEEGVRQAIAWLRADYEYGTGPEWRELGAEWIADRLADHRRGTTPEEPA